jgi:isoleucyl-tRNA synthetase
VIVTEVPRQGWAVASSDGESIALDLELTEELIAAGIARDATRLIQDARKSSGLDISDRIAVTWSSGSYQTTAALQRHGDEVAAEVLAASWLEGTVADATVFDEELDLLVQIERVAG